MILKSILHTIHRFSATHTWVFFLFLSACNITQVLDEKQSTLNSYLETLKQDPTSTGGRYECVRDSEKVNTLPQGIQKWTFVGQESRNDDRFPDSQFTLVYVKITEIDPGGFDVTNTWTATVWQSDELFEHNKRSASAFNQVMSETSTLLNDANKFLGKSDRPERKSSPIVPNRGDITSHPYCVTIIKKQT